MSQDQIPTWYQCLIIVFDERKSILYVSQGLTISTRRLVCYFFLEASPIVFVKDLGTINYIFLIPADLYAFLDKPMEVPDWPCHTQAVERAIRDLIKAGQHVKGEEARDGWLLAQAAGRQMLPRNKTKADFASFFKD